METRIVEQTTGNLEKRILMRQTPLSQWMEHPELSLRLSGTLRKNARIGFKHQEQLKAEADNYIKEWFFMKDVVLREIDGGFYAADFCSYGATIKITKVLTI